MVKFDKEEIPKGSIFKGQKKMKVVTHCQLESEILKEYYVYKMYNMFTELSFNVRLLKITYVDSKGSRPEETKYAFFIESTKHMAERNGGKELNEMIPLLLEGLWALANLDRVGGADAVVCFVNSVIIVWSSKSALFRSDGPPNESGTLWFDFIMV